MKAIILNGKVIKLRGAARQLNLECVKRAIAKTTTAVVQVKYAEAKQQRKDAKLVEAIRNI